MKGKQSELKINKGKSYPWTDAVTGNLKLKTGSYSKKRKKGTISVPAPLIDKDIDVNQWFEFIK